MKYKACSIHFGIYNSEFHVIETSYKSRLEKNKEDVIFILHITKSPGVEIQEWKISLYIDTNK